MAAKSTSSTPSKPDSASVHPIVVIGGDAAGMSAASKIKRERRDAEVIIFERSQYISYSMCGMPYWIGGVIEEQSNLFALSIERARNERGLDVRIYHEVTAIDPQAHTVTVHRLDTDETFTQPYSRLVYATGASAARPPIEGLDLPGVFTLRWMTDAEAIKQYVDEQEPKRAVVIGAGYIGLEMVEALRERRVSVHVVEMVDQILPNFDAEMVEEVRDHLRSHGVHVHLSAAVSSIAQRGDALAVEVAPRKKGEGEPLELEVDLVIVSTGVRPNVQLAKEAGLTIGATGALAVDETLCTSDPDIFAAGDCVEYNHIVTGKPAWIPLAPSANKGGRIVGENLIGGKVIFPGIAGTAVVKVFDYTLATSGITESEARKNEQFGKNGEHVGAATIEATDRAGYYPGAEPIRTKLVFDKRDGRLLGGQIVGTAGVNKRIDIVATALAARMTLDEITMLDLSYAPPYSPVYDPILVAAGVGLKDVAASPKQ
jgi:NADPH-dependent 2,4-dienoyl-CoA reductase/sulfur reductase-like enzyme